MTTSYFPWDDENAEWVKTRWLAGDSATQIAAQLSETYRETVSRNAIIGKVHRMGFAIRVMPSARPRAARKPQRPKVQPRPAQPPFRPAAPVRVFIEGPGTATILTLGAFMCKYPIGDGDDLTFCGRRTEDLRPYCARHCAICYQPPKSAKELARSVRRYI